MLLDSILYFKFMAVGYLNHVECFSISYYLINFMAEVYIYIMQMSSQICQNVCLFDEHTGWQIWMFNCVLGIIIHSSAWKRKICMRSNKICDRECTDYKWRRCWLHKRVGRNLMIIWIKISYIIDFYARHILCEFKQPQRGLEPYSEVNLWS